MSLHKKIGIDCDGVLAEWVAAFTEELARLYPGYPRMTTNTIPGWWYKTWPNLTPEMTEQAWKAVTFSRDWWERLAPIPTFPERQALTKLARDHEVYIITARRETFGDSTTFQTYRWLGNNGIHGVQVIASDHNKGALARALRLDYFLDDKPENVEEVVDCVEGCRCFIREWPWNVTTPLHWSIGSVKSLGDFINIIREQEG